MTPRHVSASTPSLHDSSSASTDSPPLSLKSPFVSPQARLLKTPGSPILSASSCQENSVRDASSVGPRSGPVDHIPPRSHLTVFRIFLPSFVRFPTALSFRTPALPFSFPSFYLAIRHSTTLLSLRLCARPTTLATIHFTAFFMDAEHPC